MRYLSLRDFAAHINNVNRPLVGVDMGKLHVGLALSDEEKTFSQPLLTLKRKHPRNSRASIHSFAGHLADVAQRHRPCGFVIGLPILRDTGALTPFCEEVISVIDKCSTEAAFQDTSLSSLSLAYTFWDERYSTNEARRLIRARSDGALKGYQGSKDKLAAALILQGFTDWLLQDFD